MNSQPLLNSTHCYYPFTFGVARENKVFCRYQGMALATNSLPELAIAPEGLDRIRRCVIYKLGIPLVSGNLLESFSMNETDFRVSGTSTK